MVKPFANIHGRENVRLNRINLMASVLRIPVLVCTVTLSWNGLSDRFTNVTYTVLGLSAFCLFLSTNGSLKLQGVFPLIAAIILSTCYSIFNSERKSLHISNLESSFLSPFISASNFDSSYIPLDDIIPAFKWIAALLSIPYLVQVFKLIDLKFLQRLKIAWIAGVLVNIVIQLFQTFSVMNIAISTLQINDLTRFRFSGLATHPNALAISVCLSLPIIYEELRKVNFTLFLATNLLFFTSVFLTQSRAGLIVYAFGFLMCFLRNENSGGFRISRLLLIIIILSTLVLSGFFFYLLNNSRFQTGDTSALISNQARWGLMKFGYEAFRISPMLGLGPTLFKVSHNIYLQVLSSLGFIGFVFFIVLCFRMIQRNWKSNYFTSVTILIFLLFGFFNNSLTDFYLYFPLGFGFLISSHNLDY